MDPSPLFDAFFYLAIFGGCLMAFSLGANDVANSMASSVGSRAITIKHAIVIAGLLNFLGAAFLGARVTSTISNGIVNPEYISDPRILAIGMFSALLTAGTWVLISTLTGAPVSSTHSIVGGVLGFGLMAAGAESVRWSVIAQIAITWVATPIFAALLAGVIYVMIKKTILEKRQKLKACRFWGSVWIFLTAILVSISFFLQTDFGRGFMAARRTLAIAVIIVAPILLALLGWRLFTKLLPEDEGDAEDVEKSYRGLLVGTSAYVALSQGANDVANAMGPVCALYLLAKYRLLPPKPDMPMWILAMGGIGIAVGVALLGYKVMQTVGEKITKLSYTKGFAVNFSVASTVLLASNMGVPVSTTTVAVGAVAGVGSTGGMKSVNFKLLFKIFLFWVATVPIAAATSCLFFLALKAICL